MTTVKNLPKKQGQNSLSRVYSYTRFSAATQSKGRGKARQVAGAEEWCQRNGYTLEPVNAYADLGVSAFKGRNAEHGDLKRFLDAVEGGKIQSGSILLIESLDRLSRNNINIAVQLLLSIINSGIVVVTLVDNATYRADAEPQSLMTQLIMSVAIFMRANDESRTKSRRKADSWKHKREQAAEGKYHGGKVPCWIAVVKGEYRLNEMAETVKNIFKDFNEGDGLYRLTHKYGIPSPTIGYWLDSRVVLGTLTVKENGTTIDIPNHYPPVVTKAVWDMAQQRRVQRFVPRRGAVGKRVNLFSGMLTDPNGVRMELAQFNGGVRSFRSRGFVVRAEYLEKVIIFDLLGHLFIRVKSVESQPVDVQAIAKVTADIKQMQATMLEEPSLAAGLLPVLRKLQQEKDRLLSSNQTITHELIDRTLIVDFAQDKTGHEERLKLRDIVRQNIKGISIKKVEKKGHYLTVSGMVGMLNGKTLPYCYGYNCRTGSYDSIIPGPEIRAPRLTTAPLLEV